MSLAIVAMIFGLPLAVVAAPAVLCPRPLVILVTLFAAPLLYSFVFGLTAGVLSRPFHRAIVPGKFPRDLRDPLYRRRRLYGLCWTCVYYFKPIYFIFLLFPFTQWLLLRLFGYRGCTRFTLYPDTWIRDLPILDIGEGAYLSNKSTIGTNLALKNGRILVEGITIGAGAMIGHLAMLAAGTKVGERAEIGHGTACSARVEIGRDVVIRPKCGIDFRVRIGDGTVVDGYSCIGGGAVIGPGLRLPFGAHVPHRARIETQQDADAILSAEMCDLNHLRGHGEGCSRKSFEQGVDSSPVSEEAP